MPTFSNIMGLSHGQRADIMLFLVIALIVAVVPIQVPMVTALLATGLAIVGVLMLFRALSVFAVEPAFAALLLAWVAVATVAVQFLPEAEAAKMAGVAIVSLYLVFQILLKVGAAQWQ